MDYGLGGRKESDMTEPLSLSSPKVTSAQIIRYYQYHQVLQTVLKTFAIHAFTITGWYHYLFFCSQYYYAS